MTKPLELPKEGLKLGKNTIISASVGVIIAVAYFIFNLGSQYTALNNRIQILEDWRSQGGRFTSQDGKILSERISSLEKRYDENFETFKEDLKEIKSDIKELVKNKK